MKLSKQELTFLVNKYKNLGFGEEIIKNRLNNIDFQLKYLDKEKKEIKKKKDYMNLIFKKDFKELD